MKLFVLVCALKRHVFSFVAPGRLKCKWRHVLDSISSVCVRALSVVMLNELLSRQEKHRCF